ncbi:MAG TPA: tRNA (adenosine(37)-N6)-threonylcarbamoyltransferase complex ATPase subunit type 1 TsaE [Nitrospira sp.]|nr:tRNA (adenosine(37)-N6)-threonylcarbamoyltransferase complex ATPase subunit type 1 TsaE [Nitrospira sp.]
MSISRTKKARRPQSAPRAPASEWTLALSSRAATEAFGRAIGRALAGGETLALSGELGAGKTALVRGIAAGLGVPPSAVSSPTFVLIHEYQGRLPLVHVDLYRLRSDADAESIGLGDYFQGHTVTAIEWADKFPTLLPADRLEITLRHKSPTTRAAHLLAGGPQSARLLEELRHTPRRVPTVPTTQAARTHSGTGRRRQP